MSFEPKIFQSDESPRRVDSLECKLLGEPALPLWDDAVQLELPDDLAALAEQLRDDAIYLAQSHPADATPEQRAAAWLEVERSAATRPRFARARWWASGVAAAAVLMGASWMGWQLSQSQDRPEVAVAPASQLSSHPPETTIDSPLVVAAANHEMNVVTGSDEVKGPRVIRLPEDSPPRVISAGAFLQDVSGPELDAMLELLAEQTDTGLSI